VAHRNPSDSAIKQLLSSVSTIAVVGASSNPDRSSHGVMWRLLQLGYHVIPVNPNETEVLGRKAYPSLSGVLARIDIVDVFRRSEYTPAIADEAVRVRAKALWLQQGIWNEDAAARATGGGLTVIMDACIGTVHAMLQVPPKTNVASAVRGTSG
jgi:predicted CoA-binding protein